MRLGQCQNQVRPFYKVRGQRLGHQAILDILVSQDGFRMMGHRHSIHGRDTGGLRFQRNAPLFGKLAQRCLPPLDCGRYFPCRQTIYFSRSVPPVRRFFGVIVTNIASKINMVPKITKISPPSISPYSPAYCLPDGQAKKPRMDSKPPTTPKEITINSTSSTNIPSETPTEKESMLTLSENSKDA